jgi:vacuolar-type H+-ATPase subunit F/Vma7
VSRVVAIGEERLLEGYALAGVEVLPAAGAAAAREAWRALPADVALVLLSPAAHEALAGELAGDSGPERIWAVVPR